MPRRKSRKILKIQVGDKVLTYGKDIDDMKDSNVAFNAGNFELLRLKLEREGYLFIRGVIPKEKVVKAREILLTQANKDRAILITDKANLDTARIQKKNNKYVDGYCIDGITGSEVNDREGIDIEAWNNIGPSDICQSVYNGKEIKSFWNHLFQPQQLNPLIQQTFIRLMGNSGTVQHADYYYFKKDTEIFNNKDGINAQKAAKKYIEYNTDLQHYKKIIELYPNHDEEKVKGKDDNDKKLKQDELECSICGNIYNKNKDLDQKRKSRLNDITKDDFGMLGPNWHCPCCAISPLAIYTTWICCSELKAPKDSILAVVPYSHKHNLWDLPHKDSQLPSDFDWDKMWKIPKRVSYGDLIIFNIKTIHASSFNKSSPRSFRISMDTRIQIIDGTDEVSNNENGANSK